MMVGASVNIVLVYTSEKGLDAYFDICLNNPFTGSRTNLVTIPKDNQTLELSPPLFS